MSEQFPPATSSSAVPATRGPRRALIAGAATAVVAVGGLLAYLIPNHGGSASGTKSDPNKTGCPSASAPPQWSAAKVTVTEGQANATIPVHVGDTVDFRLPAQKFSWDYVPGTERTVTAQSPVGYYDPSLNDCIWRLKVTTAGQSLVTFNRRMLCPPHSSLICSDIVISWRYLLNAQ